MRRLLIGLLGGIAALAAIGSDHTASAQEQEPERPQVMPVDVLQVNGLFDHIVVKSIGDAIDRAVDKQSQALVLQVDSRGAVVSDEEMAALLDRIAESPVPIGVWVGPTGARLYGAPAQILAVADVTGMAPGARVGNVGPPVSEDHPLGPGLTALVDRTVGLSDARSLAVFKQRISDEGIPTIRNMLEALDGYSENGVTLDTTTEVVTDSGTVQKQTIAAVRFSKLPLLDQLFHTVASPPVAYLLFLVGLSLLMFEFFTAGVGIAGVVGAGCTILACFGIAELPARWWAVGLLMLAMLAFASMSSRHPAVLDRRRDLLHDHRQLLVVRAGERVVAEAELAESDRRHRRHHAGLHRRDAVDGADAVRDPDDRTRMADRLGGCRREPCRSRRRGADRRGAVACTYQPSDADQGR